MCRWKRTEGRRGCGLGHARHGGAWRHRCIGSLPQAHSDPLHLNSTVYPSQAVFHDPEQALSSVTLF